MAISYVDTAWNTGGTVTTGENAYKDVTITGVAVGDLIVAFGVAENNTNTTGSVATQAGSTGAWTQVAPAVVSNNDVAFRAGYALVTAAGNVTVRITLNTTNGGVNRQGAGAFRIPAAEVGATYGFVGTGFVGSATGLASATLSGSSTVIYMAGDWAATSMGTTTVPAGGTNNRSYSDTVAYSVWASNWLAQASGTRNYGPSSLSGHDVSGVLFRMDTAGGGGSVAISATVAAVTTVSASINRRTPISAVTPVVATSAATLATRTPLSAVTVVASAVTAAVATRQALAAITPVASSTSATLQTRTALAATTPVSSAVAASIGTQGGLSAMVVVTSAVSASIATRQALAAITPVISAASADIDTRVPLAAVVAVTSTVTASIGTPGGVGVAATVVVASTTSAAIGTRQALAATVIAVTTVSASLHARVGISATIVVVSTVSAAITSDIEPTYPPFPYPLPLYPSALSLTLEPSTKYRLALRGESRTLTLKGSA